MNQMNVCRVCRGFPAPKKSASVPVLQECARHVKVTMIARTPFYLYDSIDWMNVSCLTDAYKHTKHSDDFWMLHHATTHPWRTQNASNARLFVVGGLFNLLAESEVWTKASCCIQGLCDKDLFAHAMAIVANSEWFARKKGTDHVIVASHYASHRLMSRYAATRRMNAVSFEKNIISPKYCNLASTYVGNGCRSKHHKRYDVSFVGNMAPKKKAFGARRQACSWLGHQNALSVGLCGHGRSHCPMLGESRLGLHIRGDTYGSNRLMDIFLSDAVPVFTHAEQYSILPPLFPWRDMTMLADVSSMSAFIESLLSFRNASAATQRQNQIKNASVVFDWSNPTLFEKYMTAFATRCRRRLLARR